MTSHVEQGTRGCPIHSLLTQVLGFAEDVATEIAALIAAYVLGQGVADGLSKGATSNVASLSRISGPRS